MSLQKTNTLTITTPEGIMFPLILAGPAVRFTAWLIDWITILAILSFLGPLIQVLGIISIDFSNAVYGLIYFFLSFAYYIITEGLWNGQTLGKRLLNLRVMDVQGLNLTFGQVVVRNLLRAIDSLPLYMVGGIASVVTKHNQRIGDIAANTVVVMSPKIKQLELKQVLPGKFNSFKQFPHLCARLRQNISLDLANIILQSLIRRNILEPSARIRVFKQLADHIKETAPFPEEAVLGLSDEQYLRNILEILFKDDKNRGAQNKNWNKSDLKGKIDGTA